MRADIERKGSDSYYYAHDRSTDFVVTNRAKKAEFRWLVDTLGRQLVDSLLCLAVRDTRPCDGVTSLHRALVILLLSRG